MTAKQEYNVNIPGQIEVLDTTLRDGAQMRGVSFSIEDKLKIAGCLDSLGIGLIEAGNPGSNPKDTEFFERVAALGLKNASLVAFGSTRRAGIDTGGDRNLASLLGCGARVVSLVGKCWDYHVREVLRTTYDENLRMIGESVRYLTERGIRVIFDAEHFFDGYAADPAFALECLEAACDGGSRTLCLCDTNGGAVPSQIARVTSAVAGRFAGRADIGIHCHNDAGMAAANTYVALESGAAHIQGTLNGYGERCGNADLCTVIPNIQLKTGRLIISQDALGSMTQISRRISEIANIPHDETAPYVGAQAFAHKGGMHIDGVEKAPATFEHTDPNVVGNTRRLLMSEVSGRSFLLRKLRQIAPDVEKDSPIAIRALERLKELEFEGYQYEGAEPSFELEIMKLLGKYEPSFELVEFKVMVNEPSVDGVGSTAMIKIRVNGQDEITADEGEGPVDALDRAIRKALGHFYPRLAAMKLTDYKVRVIDSGAATAAKVRVLIESTDGADAWTTIGVSPDIILASWKALVDSMEYFLHKAGSRD